MMRVLTLIQPHSYCIAYEWKDIENRSWWPYPSQLQVGDVLAIHAGLKVDKAQVAHFRKYPELLRQPLPDRFVHGAIESVVRYMGPASRDVPNRWKAMNQKHWLLSHQLTLKTPIPYRGGQGLRILPADIEQEIRRQLDPVVWLQKIGATIP